MINLLDFTRRLFRTESEFQLWLEEGIIPEDKHINYFRKYKPHRKEEEDMPGGKKVPLTQQQVNKINEMLLAGKKQTEIAHAVGTANSTVSKLSNRLKAGGAVIERAGRGPSIENTATKKKQFVKDMKRLLEGPLTPMLLTEEEVSFIRDWRKANGNE